jgi:hypothetical protein
MTTFTRTVEYEGRRREDVQPEVLALEKQAVRDLGGPVVRSHRFIDGGARCEFTWRLA